MEQLANDNMYVIDLGHIDSAAEIIFELSNMLDSENARNKKICLKLGNVDLNQAQLLSIKSLINGINSILSSVDTKSTETEKVALALGIIVSNVSAENSTENIPAMPYKSAEELKEQMEAENTEIHDVMQNSQENNHDENINNSDIENNRDLNSLPNIQENTDINEAVQNKSESFQTADNTAVEELTHNENEQKNELKDELDIIFGSNADKSSIFQMAIPEEMYESKEGITDIAVPEYEYTKEDIELESFPTKYIKQTIRSGQVISYEGNIVIIGDCHPGCEINAFGDITVWGILSGIAHAGSGGNQKARVRALKMNAIQLRIANCYSRRPDSLNTVYIEKTNSFTPEEARIVNNEIVVFKIND